MTIYKTIKQFGLAVITVVAGAIVALALGSGVATAATGDGYPEPGQVTSGVAELTGEVRGQAVQGELRESNDSGLMSGVAVNVTESDKAIPVVFAWPTWGAPTIGGVGIETSAGAIGMADSQANN